jgi:hypothetical protein
MKTLLTYLIIALTFTFIGHTWKGYYQNTQTRLESVWPSNWNYIPPSYSKHKAPNHLLKQKAPLG